MSISAPESTLPYPPIHKGKKFVVLSDWDGTITTLDSNDLLTDKLGFGEEKRREAHADILSEKTTFRDGFKLMLDSIPNTVDECKEVLKKEVTLEKGFKEFYEWTKANDIPFIVISGGMGPFIYAVLENSVGEDNAKQFEIISSDMKVHPNGTWEIQYRHPSSGYGHDKSQAILPYRNLPDPPLLFFFGDGVSDMSAAQHADVLFVKRPPGEESNLAAYCRREGIPHILFDNFQQVLPIVEAIVKGELTKEEVLRKGKAF
ncbi:hypothetical protein M422DRAFT_23550 [Sphaerobolus stellatus SS14]|nr:hypothetical protein M422DRAFT_23550 [Sphaerobolus stellatus SS14]